MIGSVQSVWSCLSLLTVCASRLLLLAGSGSESSATRASVISFLFFFWRWFAQASR
ncbi:hypothetical protein IWX92DRAFT_363344 [Phyllosticta citricarpa]